MAEYKSKGQSNYGWSLTWEAAGRFPIVAKRRFQTLADAQAFVDDTSATASATEGLIISVINDSNSKNNGIYYVAKVANTDPSYGEVAAKGELVKAGSGNGSMSVAQLTISSGKVAEATADNIGQIIYVTTGNATYPAGPYIVTGEGTVSKLGTTTATGDLSGDVETLKGQMTSLVSTVNNKADQSDLDDLSETVGEKADKSTVEDLTGIVQTKVNQSEFNTLSGTVEDLSETVEGKADQSTVNALTTTVNSKADKTALQNAIAKNAAVGIDVRLYHGEVLNNAMHAFEVEYEIYSETASALTVTKTEVLDSNDNVIATTRDGQLISIAEATYTTILTGKHDFTFRVTFDSGLTHDHKFSINYVGGALLFGYSSGSESDFTAIGTGHSLVKEGNCVSYFAGDINLSAMASGKRLSVKKPVGVAFHCLKSNGFVIPMTENEDGFYYSEPIKPGVIENVEIVYSL